MLYSGSLDLLPKLTPSFSNPDSPLLPSVSTWSANSKYCMIQLTKWAKKYKYQAELGFCCCCLFYFFSKNNEIERGTIGSISKYHPTNLMNAIWYCTSQASLDIDLGTH